MPNVPPTPAQLATLFCRILREWRSADELVEVNRRNALPEYEGLCASHDFCDPNQAMLDALAEFGLEYEGATQPELIALIDEASTIAKARRFEVG